MMITANKIDQAYTKLCQAMRAHFELSELEARCKADLDVQVLKAMNDGQIDGKNEQQRQAQIRVLFEEAFVQYEALATAARGARFQLDIARVEVELVRAILRLTEIERRSNQ